MSEPNEFEAVVPADKMPPCPLCGRPIIAPPPTRADTLMVFWAHGMAALAHDGCRPKVIEHRKDERADG
jgi:hypothetical protein